MIRATVIIFSAFYTFVKLQDRGRFDDVCVQLTGEGCGHKERGKEERELSGEKRRNTYGDVGETKKRKIYEVCIKTCMLICY